MNFPVRRHFRSEMMMLLMLASASQIEAQTALLRPWERNVTDGRASTDLASVPGKVEGGTAEPRRLTAWATPRAF